VHTRLVVTGVAVSVAIIGGGWLAADRFVSPAQRAARARPPEPTPLTAEVTRGALADEVTARATVRPRLRERLVTAAWPERAVVTSRLTLPGSPVRAGTALLVVNGRPVFVLPGQFGFYRDIAAGMDGPDVAQLQAGLAAAGYPAAVAEEGVYGTVTQDAVRQLYGSVGAEPIERPAPRPTASEAGAEGAGATRRGRVPVVPLSEVVVARHLPARARSVAAVGTQVAADAPVATLASGRLVAHAGVATSVAGRIRPAMRAFLVGPGGRSLAVRVLSVGRRHGAGGGELIDVVLAPVGRRLPPAWNGRQVLARIVTRLIRRRALIVPTRAITRAPDGGTYVLKQDRTGGFTRIAVRPLEGLGGRTAIAPRAPRALSPADRVRVG
jgi:Putative peptidoglycan binding domain